jgi:hypothetical protein
MIVAKLYPEPRRGKKGAEIFSKLDSGELSRARTVLQVIPEVAERWRSVRC